MIVKIEKLAGESGRFNIVLDDESPVLTLSKSTIEEFSIKEGADMPDKAATEKLKRKERENAYSDGLSFISYRMRSKKEIESKLKRRRYDEFAISYVIERLTMSGYIDDEFMAESITERLTSTKSVRAIDKKLRSLMIGSEQRDKVLSEISRGDQLEAVRREFTKFLKGHEDKEEKAQIILKISRRLYARGFRYDDIRQVAAEFEGDTFSE